MAEKDGMGQLLTLGLLAAGAYVVYEYFYGQPATVVTTTPVTPGTTPTQTQTQPATSVSTAPSTTTPPPSGTMSTLAANMQSNMGGTTSATADQWNYAFGQIMGKGIDQYAGFAFDAVYGPMSAGGVRNNGAQMNAMTFLQLAASAVSGGLPGLSGLGDIMNFSAPVPRQTGNMVFMWQHPLPYAPNYSQFHGLRGLGALTQTTGFERALFAGAPLHRGWRYWS